MFHACDFVLEKEMSQICEFSRGTGKNQIFFPISFLFFAKSLQI